MHIDASIELAILHFKGSKILQNVFLSLKSVFIFLADSADPDEMPHNVAFHLGLHCLPEYLFTGVIRKLEHDPSNYTMDHPKFIVSNQRRKNPVQ